MRVTMTRNPISRTLGPVLCVALANSSFPYPAWSAEPVRKVRIAFAGDSLADNYWEGVVRFVDGNACLKKTLELGRFARNSTGLSRGDLVYWPREVKRIGETFKPALFVITIGVNDRQFIVNGSGGRTAWGSPYWTARYLNEISEFIKGATASKAAVLWFGLPVMRSSVDNNDATEKNKMYAQVIAESGTGNVKYAEPWRLHPSGVETYSASGAGRNGKLMPIRTSDGQHFTTPGEDLLAAYAFPKILAALGDAGIRLDECLETPAKEAR
jgi:uncharacterized protein